MGALGADDTFQDEGKWRELVRTNDAVLVSAVLYFVIGSALILSAIVRRGPVRGLPGAIESLSGRCYVRARGPTRQGSR